MPYVNSNNNNSKSNLSRIMNLDKFIEKQSKAKRICLRSAHGKNKSRNADNLHYLSKSTWRNALERRDRNNSNEKKTKTESDDNVGLREMRIKLCQLEYAQ